MKKRILSFVLAIVLILALMPGALASSDQPSGWAQGYVNEAISHGLVPQHLQTRFTSPVTRAEFAALGVALYQSTTGREITGRVTFTDTNDVNVQMMAYVGVVRGVGGDRFNPDGLITRQESAAMLSRLISVTGTALPVISPTFADNDAISNWAENYVGQVRVLGIMGGVGGNRFDPQGRYTIEQSIVTMLRVFQMDELGNFFCGIPLGLVRNGGIGGFPGTGVDFIIGELSTVSGPGWSEVHGMLNFAEPHWLVLDSFAPTMSGPDGTQTGDVFLTRRVVDGVGIFWRVNIDIGNLFEVWEARGLCFDELFRQNPLADETWRAYATFAGPVGDCNC